MIESSAAYKAAITGDARRVLLKAVVDITDPDITYKGIESSAEAWVSKNEQLVNKKLQSTNNYQTLEHNRWLLSGNSSYFPKNKEDITEEVGYISEAISGHDGYFNTPIQIKLNFANVSVLQAFTVVFNAAANDGYATELVAELIAGDSVICSWSKNNNDKTTLIFEDFTAYEPTAIELTILRWSRPGRRVRVVEIIPGIYEEWGNDELAQFETTQQADVTNMSVRYGTANLKIDNQAKRFAPRNKTGILKSIEERQGIDLSIGVRLPNGKDEYKKIGTYYQYAGGWKTGDNSVTITWQLVDIIGLVSNREFIVPPVLPRTLSEWVAAVVSQLGPNFSSHYYVHPTYANLPVIANKAEDVSSRKCGDILRFACMVTETWAKADAVTGYISIETLSNDGNEINLDNMKSYPTIIANNDVAALVINIYDSSVTNEKRQLIIAGTNAAAENTATIDNPFVHTDAMAATIAKNVLIGYGGNRIETISRGDPSSEIGDLDAIWLKRTDITNGRRIKQSFNIKNGILTDCKSTFIETITEVVGN